MLGKKINETRIALGWSQVILAQKLNVTKQTVSNWENDNIQPSIEMLVRLANLFGVTTDYLLGLDDNRYLCVDGLPNHIIAHLSLLVEDYRQLPSGK